MSEGTQLEPSEHMRRKQPEYWMDLVGGVTGRYKTEQIQRILAGKTLPTGTVVVDVCAGTSALSKMVAEEGGVDKILCIDYDAGIVDAGRAAEADPRVEWRVADARDLGAIPEAIGAVTFLDILLFSPWGLFVRRPRSSRCDRTVPSGILGSQHHEEHAYAQRAPSAR